jgi:hypothetical protein
MNLKVKSKKINEFTYELSIVLMERYQRRF